MKTWLALLAVAIVAAAAGFGVSRWWLDPERTPGLIDAPNPGFELASIDGSVVNAADFEGRVLLVNFWATWCAPCREEMPMLQSIAQELDDEGFSVVGVALDDIEPVRRFVAETGVTYPVLVGATDVMAENVRWGNEKGLLPYSVLVDRDGVVRWAHLGELKEAELRARVGRWL